MMNLNHKGWEKLVFNGLRVVGVVSLLCVQSIFLPVRRGRNRCVMTVLKKR